MRADVETDVLILLYDVARHMRTHADQMAREHGLTPAQWIILVRLERRPDLSQNEFAAIAEVAPITVARLVDRLEALGLIKRCIDAEDRRIWRLRLTPAATPVLRDIKRPQEALRNHDQGHRRHAHARPAVWVAQDEGEHQQHAPPGRGIATPGRRLPHDAASAVASSAWLPACEGVPMGCGHRRAWTSSRVAADRAGSAFFRSSRSSLLLFS